MTLFKKLIWHFCFKCGLVVKFKSICYGLQKYSLSALLGRVERVGGVEVIVKTEHQLLLPQMAIVRSNLDSKFLVFHICRRSYIFSSVCTD